MDPERWHRIEKLYNSVVEHSPADRPSLLAQADPDIRAEVEAMLAQPAGGALLDQPAGDLLGESGVTQLGSGTLLGHYRIVAMLGQGGMGVVYRAQDTKLGREVAIKVLPDSLAQDPDRLARFNREATLLASLNHPNIGHIYGVESQALVMELVHGETLNSLMKPGPLPIETVLDYAKQIAEALEAAHEKGIIHRDLKPANIMVTPAGVVKVLDFGLAKAEELSSARDPAESPTAPVSFSRAGMVLGTAAYMSPEQARGAVVDKRTDIWAFGVVVYEMLTGKHLFAGEMTTDILSAVLTQEPEWDRVPSQAQRLLRRCLEKDPRQRLRDIGDARFLLEEAPTKATAAPRRILPWAVAAILAMIDLGPDVSLATPDNYGSSVIISPDGTRVVYKASVSGGPPKLFTRRLDQPKATELSGTEGAVGPFFSPDGKWVGFGVGNKISKVSVEGGAVIPLSEVAPFGGARWGEGGNIIVEQIGKGLVRISSDGGAPTPLTELASGELTHMDPQVLPGGQALLFVAGPFSNDIDKDNIDVVTLSDRHRKTLFHGGTSPHYLPSGHLVYASKGTLFGIPFDLAACV
jgi:serine/threonine protein kinase